MGVSHEPKNVQASDKVYYMRQYVGNACGTVGILHALVKHEQLRCNFPKQTFFCDVFVCPFFAMCFSATPRSEEHTSELQSLMRISYAVFCLKKKNQTSVTSTISY